MLVHYRRTYKRTYSVRNNSNTYDNFNLIFITIKLLRVCALTIPSNFEFHAYTICINKSIQVWNTKERY